MDTSDPRVIEKSTDLRFVRDHVTGRVLLEQRCRVQRVQGGGTEHTGWSWLPVAGVGL